MAYGIKDFDTIVSDIIAAILLRSSKITDFSPGGIMRSFTEGVSVALEDFYMSTYKGFRDYLQNIQKYVFEFPQKTGTKSSANVVFSRSDTTEEAIIPIGTEVQTATGLKFSTTAATTILAGVASSSPIEVEAAVVGLEYNVSAGSINTIASSVPNVDTVTNSAAAAGGTEKESSIAFKSRFLDYVEGLAKSNVSGLRAVALGVSGITSVYVYEHFPPVSNRNVTLYIDDGSSSGVSAAKVAEVQGIIDGDGTDDNPGYRAAGVNVIVEAASVVLIDIIGSVDIITDVDESAVETQIIDEITYYLATLGIGQEVIYNKLNNSIIKVFGTVDCNITTPSANQSISGAQVARAGTFSLSFNEV